LSGGCLAPPPAYGPDGKLANKPTKEQVVAAMACIASRVVRCYDQFKEAGLATARITVAPTGEVSSATVAGSLAETQEARCIEQAIRKARFAEFDGPPMTINYPFMLR
jgi:hypothetical protein